jgi:hypothetical protein
MGRFSAMGVGATIVPSLFLRKILKKWQELPNGPDNSTGAVGKIFLRT